MRRAEQKILEQGKTLKMSESKEELFEFFSRLRGDLLDIYSEFGIAFTRVENEGNLDESVAAVLSAIRKNGITWTPKSE
jgi:hypothetical protein